MIDENDVWRNADKWGLCCLVGGHNVFFTFKELRDALLLSEGHNDIKNINFNHNNETAMPIELLKEFINLCTDGGQNNDERRN